MYVCQHGHPHVQHCVALAQATPPGLLLQNCSFHVVRGTVGDLPLAVSNRFTHYATQTRPATPGERSVPSIELAALEQQLGLRFDTLLIDCEGCIDSFFMGSNRQLLHRLSTIIMEEDAPAQVT
jgi:hypothetical protein